LAIFSKNKPQEPSFFEPDPRKAKRFFEHAQTVAESRNYDYAIECYVSGLRLEPDNLVKYQALREVALKRSAGGGKAATLTEKLGDRFKKGGRSAVDRLLDVVMMWSKDPVNVTLAVEVMARAVEADKSSGVGDLNLSEVAYWVGTLVLDPKQAKQRPTKAQYVKTRDLFAQIQAYRKAAEACRFAMQLDPSDGGLVSALKNLEAEQTMQEGGYTAAGGREGGFRKMVRDADQQKALEQDQAVSKTKSMLDQMIERRRADYLLLREDVDRLQKLVGALLEKDTNEADEEAAQLLRDVWEKTGQYRFKLRMGDVKMRGFTRRVKLLKVAAKADPENRGLRKQLQDMAGKQLQFELEEFTERVRSYPTDLGLRFELGKRMFALGKYDEAIAAFQQTKGDPKFRAAAHELLGRCYAIRGWLDEAIDTLRQGIESHPSKDDRLAMALRYQLMSALKQAAVKGGSLGQAKEAQKVASQVLQTDINFMDIRQQMDELKKLIDELQDGQRSG
jgi:tetratricopeptide (TPR) repeat protein